MHWFGVSHQSIISPANHQDIHSIEDWQRRFAELREQTGSVPIGLKIVASHIEDDLKVALAIKPDFIIIDNRAVQPVRLLNAIKLSIGVQTFRFGSSLILNRIFHYLRFGFQ